MDVISHKHVYESRNDMPVRFVCIGDIHRGNPWMDEDRLYKTINWVQENDCYVILMGDYGEAINAKDPRHDYNALDGRYATPDTQYRKTIEDLTPIKDKILFLLEGNHEANFWRRNNHNYADQVAHGLGVPYTGISAYLLFKFYRKTGKSYDRRTFETYAHHGWAGGRTAGYQVKTIHDLNNIFPNAHMYIMGHNHQLGEALPKTHLYIDKRTEQIREFTQHFFFTGSYIKGHEKGKGSYVEARAYQPTMIGSPVIEVQPNRVDTHYDKRTPLFSIRYTTLDWL